MFLYFSQLPHKEPSQPFFLEISITFASVEVFVYVLGNPKNVYSIPYLFYANLLKITTLRPGNRKQNRDVLSRVCGGGWLRVPIRDRQQEHGVFLRISHHAAKRVAGARAKRGRFLLSFLSMGSCPAQVSKKLHSTILNCFGANLATPFVATVAGANPRLCIQSHQGQACEFQCPASPFFFPLQCSSNSELQHRHQLGPVGPKEAEEQTLQVRSCPTQTGTPHLLPELLCNLLPSCFLFQGRG